MKPGRVLDVGAASGFVLAGLQDGGWQGRGIEPNDTMAAYGREVLKMDVETGPFETFEAKERFDLVSMIQVLPHFYDLDRALFAAAKATQDNGYWLVEIWNRGSWTANVFGSHWHEYSPPSVVRWFAPYDLGLAAAKFGFEQVASGRPRRWVHGAHAKSLLGSKLAPKGFAAQALRKSLSVIPDNLHLPYPSEDLHWALFRKVRQVSSEVLLRRENPLDFPKAAE
jgi:SAM-dependent methyltransferase